MSRQIICYEGEEKVPGQILEIGSVWWEEGKTYPVTWTFDLVRPPVGDAFDIRREDDYAITADIRIRDKQVQALLGESAATFWGRRLQDRRRDGRQMVRFVEVGAVSIVVAGTVPWRWNDA